jgi:EAL domain-containing protein (putative c-di-GMP-specific phosphodiesterase class I)/CheY-like chemotaxis protein
VRGGGVGGVEALLRWRCPKRGLVAPLDFIPLAEESGLIIPIGEWVLKEACAQLRRWQQDGLADLRVAVNISGVQWRQNDMVEVIEAALRESGLAATSLELELTESVVMQNPTEAIRMLDRLNAMGVRLAIDDFGTGYSSLAYLKRFPLDCLKIDRAFIHDVTADADDALLTMAMINMAHNLKLTVVAEGVETEAQLNFLRSHGCDVVQGFHFSIPLSAQDCERFLREGTSLRGARPAASALTVLLVDDKPSELELMERSLLPEGFRLLKAESVESAYAQLAADEVQVVISDYRMLPQNGVEFLSNVRRLYPATIRILITLSEDFSIVPRAINQAGIHKFLSKAWDAERLRFELRDACEKFGEAGSELSGGMGSAERA